MDDAQALNDVRIVLSMWPLWFARCVRHLAVAYGRTRPSVRSRIDQRVALIDTVIAERRIAPR